MSERIQLDGELSLVATRDTSTYPDRFSLAPGQESELELDLIRQVRAKTGFTAIVPLSHEAGAPVHQPIGVSTQKLLRICDDYSARLSRIVATLADEIGGVLLGKNARFFIQVVYSEQRDNGENMFGDYLYISARVFPVA